MQKKTKLVSIFFLQSFFLKFSVSSVLPPCFLWFYSKIDFEGNII